MKKLPSQSEIYLSLRKTWEIDPCTKVFKKKKAYNRKDKSWKKYDSDTY